MRQSNKMITVNNDAKHAHVSRLIAYAGLMQDAAIECYDLKTFFKYHKICLRLIEYRINLMKRSK